MSVEDFPQEVRERLIDRIMEDFLRDEKPFGAFEIVDANGSRWLFSPKDLDRKAPEDL